MLCKDNDFPNSYLLTTHSVDCHVYRRELRTVSSLNFNIAPAEDQRKVKSLDVN
jgi:hypothetical protein